jgi:small subunit ribosomal protein S21
VQVFVRDNNVDHALKALKKKMQREGLFREMKLRGLKSLPRGESGRRQKPSVAPASSPAKSCNARVYCR